MSSASILGVIQHYQRSIEHSQDDEGRLLHCINKLYKLPVKVEHLQETGVGKTVNSLRKYNGEIGVAAKALVTKWKAMVAAEEEPAEVNNDNDDDDDDMNNANGHGSSDEDRHNRTERKSSPQEHTHSNTLTENTSKDRQTTHRDKTSSEHKSKSYSDSKTHKHEHSTTKRKRDLEQEEKEQSLHKKSKHEVRKNEGKNRENDRHKASEEKSRRHHEHDEKQNSNRDAKTTSSTSAHHKNGGDSKEKKESVKGVKCSEHTSSTRRETNSSSEKTNNKGESEKHRSSKDKDRHERSKENKHDKSKTSSKDTSSHRDKHHNSSISHSSGTSSRPSTSTNEHAAPSSSHTKGDSRNSSRKRQQDSDSNDSTPAKTKVSKISKANKQKVAAANDNEDEVDADDGIDSSMGANFADVLGMLNIPTKKSKKSVSSNKSPTVSTSSRSTTNDKASSSSSSSKNARTEYKPSPISTATISSKPVDAKPDLLSATAKLAPLDPSIALELPTISTNYKPLPHNKTVMDCIYRNSSVLSTPKPVRTLTDAEALNHGISSKTMRTKIYSGVKTGQILQVPSLFDLCIRVLQKNIDGLEYTGGVPFDVLRPILDRATPQQLLTFEEYNPYLMEDSDCLWQIHVQRNYRSKKRLEMESWREMYLRCEEEKEQKLNSLTATIKQSQKIIAAPVRKTQLAFVDSMVKPPRNVMRKQEQFGTKAKLVATPAARVAALSSVTPNAGKVGDTRLRVAATVRDAAQVSHAPMRAKKAPLMAKTLQFIRGRHKR